MCESNHLNSTTKDIQQCIKWLKQGRLLVYPTESVWGIGCDAMNQNAVMNILNIKKRPIDKGMIVVTDSVARIQPLLEGLTLKKDIIASWQSYQPQTDKQQATTWLLPLNKQTYPIPHWITGSHNSVAVRVIQHPLIQQICQGMVSIDNPYGFIISTSCNPSGQPPAYNLKQAMSYFENSNSLFLDANVLNFEQPSQIKDALTGNIIR